MEKRGSKRADKYMTKLCGARDFRVVIQSAVLCKIILNMLGEQQKRMNLKNKAWEHDKERVAFAHCIMTQ